MSRDRVNTPLNAAVAGEFLAACAQIRRGSSRRGIDSLLLVALATGACVREYPADALVPGVVCLAGTCLPEEIDRRQSTFLLAPDCGQPAVAGSRPRGITPDRMTLIGDGQDVVFSGYGAWIDDGTQTQIGDMDIALARFDAGDAAGCLSVQSLSDPQYPGVVSGAHLVGSGGDFYSLVGTAAGTTRVLALTRDQASWRPLDYQPPASWSADAPNWIHPNAVAARLDGGGVVVVRSLSTSDPTPPGKVPPVIEWLDGIPEAPLMRLQTWPVAPARGAIASSPGHVRLFPGLDAGSRAAGGFLLMGDGGLPLLFSRDNDQPQLLDPRSAQPGAKAPNFGAATVLLPLRSGETGYRPGSVLGVGGGMDPSPMDPPKIDIFDPQVSVDRWRAVASLPLFWRFGTAVLLPDGQIMLAGGNEDELRQFYLDPGPPFVVNVGRDHLARPRGPGVGALLLADGRVLISSGYIKGLEPPSAPPDVEVWEPPYLVRAGGAGRPAVRAVSGAIRAGAGFTIQLEPGGPAIGEVVLLAYGSSFFGNELNQRLIQLDVDAGASDARSGRLALNGPPPGWAPAGRYLLFALDRQRIPSVGIPVDVVD